MIYNVQTCQGDSILGVFGPFIMEDWKAENGPILSKNDIRKNGRTENGIAIRGRIRGTW